MNYTKDNAWRAWNNLREERQKQLMIQHNIESVNTNSILKMLNY